LPKLAYIYIYIILNVGGQLLNTRTPTASKIPELYEKVRTQYIHLV
jgi:hypothetical protein